MKHCWWAVNVCAPLHCTLGPTVARGFSKMWQIRWKVVTPSSKSMKRSVAHHIMIYDCTYGITEATTAMGESNGPIKATREPNRSHHISMTNILEIAVPETRAISLIRYWSDFIFWMIHSSRLIWGTHLIWQIYNEMSTERQNSDPNTTHNP